MSRRHVEPPKELEDTPLVLDGTHVALRNMLADSRITSDVFYKNIVALSMRWIALGRVEDAVGMVTELPADYVRHVLPEQMRLDPDFRQVALGVARRLAQNPLEMDEADVALALMLLEKPKNQA